MLTRQSPDSFWLRYSWSQFGSGKESATGHAHHKKAIVRSLVPLNGDELNNPFLDDTPFRTLAGKSMELDDCIWHTPICSLFDPYVKNAASNTWKKLWDEDKQRYKELIGKRSTITWSGPSPQHQSLDEYIDSLFVKEATADEEIMFLPNNGGSFIRVLYDAPGAKRQVDLQIEQRIKVPGYWMEWDDGWSCPQPW